MTPCDRHMLLHVVGGAGAAIALRSSSIMAVLIHPGAIPTPFTSSKKGSFNFASQRKAVDYYATAVKTLEVRIFNT